MTARRNPLTHGAQTRLAFPGDSLQPLIDELFALGGGTLLLAPGTYRQSLVPKSNVSIIGAGSGLSIIEPLPGADALAAAAVLSDVNIRHVALAVTGAGSGFRCAFAGTRMVLEDVAITHVDGDAISIGSASVASANMRMVACIMTGSGTGRSLVAVDVRQLTIRDSEASCGHATAANAAIQLSYAGAAASIQTCGLHITDVKIACTGTGGILIGPSGSSVKFLEAITIASVDVTHPAGTVGIGLLGLTSTGLYRLATVSRCAMRLSATGAQAIGIDINRPDGMALTGNTFRGYTGGAGPTQDRPARTSNIGNASATGNSKVAGTNGYDFAGGTTQAGNS